MDRKTLYRLQHAADIQREARKIVQAQQRGFQGETRRLEQLQNEAQRHVNTPKTHAVPLQHVALHFNKKKKPTVQAPDGKDTMHYLSRYLLEPMERHRSGIIDLFDTSHTFELLIYSPYPKIPPLIISSTSVDDVWHDIDIWRHISLQQYDKGQVLNEVTMDGVGRPISISVLDETLPIWEAKQSFWRSSILENGWNRIPVYDFTFKFTQELLACKYHENILNREALAGKSLMDWLQ